MKRDGEPVRWLGRCLAPDACCPTRVLQDDLPRRDWERMLRLAHGGLVASQWWSALCRRGLQDALSPDMRDHLEAVHALNGERNARLRAELRRVLELCNRLGAEPVLLKGALALLPDAAPEYAARFMSDLDLWLPPEALETCRAAVQRELGYRHWCQGVDAGHHHLPPLYHPSAGVRLELHREVFPHRWQALLSATELAQQSALETWDGVRLRRPLPSHRALHNLGHTLLANRALAQCRLELRQLYDLVLLRQDHEAEIDWADLQRRLAHAGQGAALGAYLLSAETIFGQARPAGVQPGWRAQFAARMLEDALRARPPRWIGGWRFADYWGWRAMHLPRRLLTPSWYGMKYRALRAGAPL